MSLVALPAKVPMVTAVAVARVVPPFSVAFTVMLVALSSSPNVSGLAVSVIPVGASSSSVIVVLTVAVPSVGVAPPPPEGLDMLTVKVSPVPSSMTSSAVCTVKVLSAWSAWVKVNVPLLAV